MPSKIFESSRKESFVTDIFERRELSFFENRNYVGMSVLMIFLIIILLAYIFEFELKGILAIILLVLYFLFLILKIFALGKERLPVTNRGILVISSDAVSINHHIYPLETIKKIEILLSEYDGMVKNSTSNSFKSLYSMGLGNFLEMETLDGQSIRVEFKLRYKDHKSDLKEFSIRAVQLNLLTPLEAGGLIGLDSYKEIQEFKKLVAEKNQTTREE